MAKTKKISATVKAARITTIGAIIAALIIGIFTIVANKIPKGEQPRINTEQTQIPSKELGVKIDSLNKQIKEKQGGLQSPSSNNGLVQIKSNSNKNEEYSKEVLKALYDTITIASFPAEAEIFLNDTFYGTTNKQIIVNKRKIIIRVELNGYVPQKDIYDPNQNQKTFNFRLKK
jgi:hypothetical protein